MTDKQRKKFSEILDLNWDVNCETNATKKFELVKKLNAKKEELKTSMGEVEYNKFINAGQKLFAPKN